MTKLIYPKSGIYTYSRNYIELCSNNISKAIANCNFDIPLNFAYKSYLNGLNNTLNNYSKEINSIDSSLKETNNNYENLSINLSNEVKKMDVIKIEERDRMII